MSLNAKKAAGGNGGSQKRKQPTIEAGTYPVRLVQIIDLGIQPQRPYKGQEKPPCHQIQLTYEFLDEFMVDEEGNEQEDKPRWISEQMPFKNLKAERAKSTQRYFALDPNEDHEGDFTQLLGAPANALITTYDIKNGPNAGSKGNKVESLSAMRPKDARKCPELVNEPKLFVLDDPDMDVFLSLPEFLQDKIKENLEFKGSALEALLRGDKPAPEADPQDDEDDEPEAPSEPDMDDEEDDLPWE